MGKQWKQCQTLFFWAPKSLRMVTAAMKLKDAYSLEEKLWPTWIAYSKADSIFKGRDITLPTKVHLVKAMVFPVVMNGCEQGGSTNIPLADNWIKALLSIVLYTRAWSSFSYCQSLQQETYTNLLNYSTTGQTEKSRKTRIPRWNKN